MIVGAKNTPSSLIGKRLFQPMLTLLFVFMLSTTGFMLIPGADDLGNTINLTFLDAFFITSYTATTIGFGEIPYPFTEDQKLWMIFVIYTSVVAWLYNIGSIIHIFQDKSLWNEISEITFKDKVSKANSDFYIVLGFGRTGEWVTEILDKHGKNVIVVDPSESNITKLKFKKYNNHITCLNSVYSSLSNIKAAGIASPYCKGVFILGSDTDENRNSLVICKSFNKHVTVKAKDDHVKNIYARTGADNIINLEALIKLNLFNIFHRQSLFILESMLEEEISDSSHEITLPSNGIWVIWGYESRLTQISKLLKDAGNEVVILKSLHPPISKDIPKNIAGIIATGNDIDNIIFINNSRKHGILPYTIAINEKYSLHELYDQLDVDYVIKPWLLFVENIFIFIGEPLINNMLSYLSTRNKSTTDEIVSKIADIYVDNEQLATTWSYNITEDIRTDELILSFGDPKDHVIIYSSFLKTNVNGNLRSGDKVLISSRYPVHL
jgi:Trk K+ transport system NAD-binding subunit